MRSIIQCRSTTCATSATGVPGAAGATSRVIPLELAWACSFRPGRCVESGLSAPGEGTGHGQNRVGPVPPTHLRVHYEDESAPQDAFPRGCSSQ